MSCGVLDELGHRHVVHGSLELDVLAEGMRNDSLGRVQLGVASRKGMPHPEKVPWNMFVSFYRAREYICGLLKDNDRRTLQLRL